MAKAVDADRAWRAERGHDQPSPIGALYDVGASEGDLLRFIDSDVDLLIDELVATYRSSTPTQRGAMLTSIGLDDAYALLLYARRCAVRAMRAQNAPTAVDGLTAVSMVPVERVDPRDLPQPVGLLFFVLGELGEDAAGICRQVGGTGASEAAQYVAAFPDRFGDGFKLSDWMYRAIDTPNGVGFVDQSIDQWEPTFDLLGAGLAIAEVLEADKYRASLEVASGLPGVWIGSGPRSTARADRQPLADSARAGLAVHGYLRPGTTERPEDQMFVVFMSEMRSSEDAAQIAAWATEARRPASHVGFGFSVGVVAAVVVARSTVMGVEHSESELAIERFREPFVRAVEACV
ncbi:MAG TPA: hypothetical protein VGC47_05700 [Acidimicrobiia bacterium]